MATEPIDFLATKAHFREHLQPVWDALPEELRGKFHSRAPRRPARTVAVASGTDRHEVSSRRVILFQHGIGQSYGEAASRTWDYPGDGHQRGAIAFPSPNRHASYRWRDAYPELPAPIVGTPRMDRWHRSPPKPVPARPTVAVSFHWDCAVAPETQTSFQEYADAVLELSREPSFDLIGHAHPSFPGLFRWYDQVGIEAVRTIDEVFSRADVYACDNSSTLYEFASLDRPVVVVNGSHYRRDADHGLRFWDYADVGVNCDRPSALIRRVADALDDPAPVADRRREITDDLFPHRYDAARVAAVIVEELLSV